MAKMAGPFIPLPKEVILLLDAERGKSLQYYVVMLCKCFIETVEDTDTEWVGAHIHDSQREIMQKIGGGGNIRRQIFPRWEELGVIKWVGGGLYLPMYYRKGDAYIQPLKMQKEIGALKQAHGETKSKQIEMEKTIKHLLDLLSDRRKVITLPRDLQGRDSRPPGSRFATPEVAAVSLLSHRFKKIPLSVINKVVTIFYQGIGKGRISGAERIAAQKIFRSLQKDGFSPYEIAFAVDWTIKPGNVSEKMRSFGIISSTIGTAVEVLQKMKEKEAREEEVAQEHVSKTEQRENEAAEIKALEEIKAAMSTEDQQALRDQAVAELNSLGVYKAEMITDILINIQENAILRKKSSDSTDSAEADRLKDVTEVEGTT